MYLELEKARGLIEKKKFTEALEMLLPLEDSDEGGPEILKLISLCYKNSGDSKNAFVYFKAFTDSEHKKILQENKAKTEELNNALTIHQSRKETKLLQEKNTELQKANDELNNLRKKKNEILEIISEELKLPIVTIQGISMNHFRKISDDKSESFDEIKKDLELVENLSQDILKNVNSILEKNKEEHRA
ncbi:MAG: HAMP domain-containing histidine kinase [Bacteroidetes bacterium]|nr:HAMP domain-containing histidine kinase [Bacteroidota bacterium]